jgi:23S rRNA (uracil1939-C5)-methyltransferase
VPRGSFFQVNPAVADALVAAARAKIEELAPEVAVDLHCGVGVFALAAGTAGVQHVAGVDVDPRAVRAARRNAKDLGLRVDLFAMSASRGIERVLAPCQPENTLVIADPPRIGLRSDEIDGLCDLGVANILYVSCAVDTLVRDMARFRERGYKVRSAQLFDMFPRTPYFETLTWIQKG